MRRPGLSYPSSAVVQGWTGRNLIRFIKYVCGSIDITNKTSLSFFFLRFTPQVLQADDHVSIKASGRIVQIAHAQVSDTGRYTCIATNIAGEDEKDFDVNIQGDMG